MIPRYSRTEMTNVWSDNHKFQTWLQVEVAATQGWAKEGTVPETDAELIAKNATVNPENVITYIEETHHDVTAFIRSVTESLGEEGRWIHYGLTSSDVWDTATSLQCLDALGIIESGLADLEAAVRKQAAAHMHTLCIGRTHGIHAEPTTFGMKLAVWLTELKRHSERLELAKRQIGIGQLSGPVGTHASVPPVVEEIACNYLGLEVADATTQILQRDRHAFLVNCIAGLAGTLEKFATELRNLQRTEVAEVEEPFTENAQTGSSSMPHKRNPELSERVCGIARTLRGYAVTANENIALWHERDISHSGAERIILPDAFGLLDYALYILTGVIEGLNVKTDRMQENLHLPRGLIFSSKALNALITAGMTRQDAYKIVQVAAMKSHGERLDFREQLETHQEVDELLTKEQINDIFNPQSYLNYVDVTFKRIGLIE